MKIDKVNLLFHVTAFIVCALMFYFCIPFARMTAKALYPWTGFLIALAGAMLVQSGTPLLIAWITCTRLQWARRAFQEYNRGAEDLADDVVKNYEKRQR